MTNPEELRGRLTVYRHHRQNKVRSLKSTLLLAQIIFDLNKKLRKLMSLSNAHGNCMHAHGFLDDDKTDNSQEFFTLISYTEARNRREDVQNLSIRYCAGLWGSHGKFACFCSMLQYSQEHSPHL